LSEERKVALFATCINDVMFPDTCMATARLLERLGCVVSFPPGQTCCGQMFTNTGYFREAISSVRACAEAFEPYDYVVGPSGSCVGSIREQHPMLAEMSGDVALQQAVGDMVAKTYELTEFLIDILGVEDVGAYFPHRVTFHQACHSLRITNLGDRPRRLMEKVRGLTLLPLEDDDQCCGFGGTFSIKNASLSADMVSEKARRVADSGAEYLVTVDNACLMNIGGALHRDGIPVRTIHLAEILASQGNDRGAGGVL
jgi:L-lactate dehydrogenase complex protein LldE